MEGSSLLSTLRPPGPCVPIPFPHYSSTKKTAIWSTRPKAAEAASGQGGGAGSPSRPALRGLWAAGDACASALAHTLVPIRGRDAFLAAWSRAVGGRLDWEGVGDLAQRDVFARALERLLNGFLLLRGRTPSFSPPSPFRRVKGPVADLEMSPGSRLPSRRTYTRPPAKERLGRDERTGPASWSTLRILPNHDQGKEGERTSKRAGELAGQPRPRTEAGRRAGNSRLPPSPWSHAARLVDPTAPRAAAGRWATRAGIGEGAGAGAPDPRREEEEG